MTRHRTEKRPDSTEASPSRLRRAVEVDRGGRRATGGGRGSRVDGGGRSFGVPPIVRRAMSTAPRSETRSPRTFRGGGADRPRRARAAHAHRDPVAAGAPDVPAGQRRAARAPRALGPGARDGRDARRGDGEREHRGRCTARHEVMRRGTRRAQRQARALRGHPPTLALSKDLGFCNLFQTNCSHTEYIRKSARTKRLAFASSARILTPLTPLP